MAMIVLYIYLFMTEKIIKIFEFFQRNKRKSLKMPGKKSMDALTRKTVKILEPPRGKTNNWFPNRSDTNRPVQSQKQARSLKFRI